MARSLVDLEAELTKKAPRFVGDDPIGQLILRALARAIRAADLRLDVLTARLDRATAAAGWLDFILINLGLRPRDAWEDDAAVRGRAYLAPDGPTPAAISDAARASYAPSEALELTLTEPLLIVLDVDFYWDLPGATFSALDGARFLVALTVPVLEPHTSSDEVLDVDFYWNLAYLDPWLSDLMRNPYLRIAQELDRRTPAGVAQLMVLEDTVEDAHIPLIWLTTTGFIL
jgi:hypothetical protein